MTIPCRMGHPLPRHRRIFAFGASDPGKHRRVNEDAWYGNPSTGLFIVADGMGGRLAGKTAGSVVVKVLPGMIREMLSNTTPSTGEKDIRSILSRALSRLSSGLYEKSRRVSSLSGLGSTAAVVLIHCGTVYSAWAGDSRIYLFENNILKQISTDQTTAAELVRSGWLDAAQLYKHPLQHALEQYIGKEGHLAPGTHSCRPEPGYRLLLCTDGLTKGLSDCEIQGLLRRHADPESACLSLVRSARDADGSDNITALVIGCL